MRTFEHFNQSGDSCPICGTIDDKQTALVKIDGTQKGGICEAFQVHVDCIDLTAYRKNGLLIIAMVVDDIKNQDF